MMKRDSIIVSFSYVCLIAFVHGEHTIADQASTSITNFMILVKEWLKETKEFNLQNVYVVDVVKISNVSEAFDNLKHILDTKNKNEDVQNDLANKNTNNENSYGVNIKNENYTTDTKNFDPTNKTESNQFICTDKDERYPVPGSCDSYIECRNGRPEEKLCPDGLRYKHNTRSNTPCQYPADVQCSPGSKLQPPKPTEYCPNQNGYFKTEDRYNCSSFRICENGIAYDYNCPDNLAFNSETSRCDWPSKVPQCNVESFLKFRCPKPNDTTTNLNTTRGYRYSRDCNVYFLCINDKPRRTQCDEYYAFHVENQTCVPAFLVPECSMEQQKMAARFVKRISNNEYITISNALHDDRYFINRGQSLSFSSSIKKPQTIS